MTSKSVEGGDAYGYGRTLLSRLLITHLISPSSLPEIPRTFRQVETIYRKRYLDLISNRESFDRFSHVQKSFLKIRHTSMLKVSLKSKHLFFTTKLVVLLLTHSSHHNAKHRYDAVSDELTWHLIVGMGVFLWDPRSYLPRVTGMDATHNLSSFYQGYQAFRTRTSWTWLKVLSNTLLRR